MWQQWANAILGLWVVAAPFIGIGGSALAWTLAITGIVIAILGVWGALQEQSMEEELHELQLQHQ
ncbi:MAG TPA: SPW repeat protein [Candidatus Paceibacterota bacterium]|nr:SPW repeat protein [Candidatus Paceibacterota bacterium]